MPAARQLTLGCLRLDPLWGQRLQTYRRKHRQIGVLACRGFRGCLVSFQALHADGSLWGHACVLGSQPAVQETGHTRGPVELRASGPCSVYTDAQILRAWSAGSRG